MSALQIYGRSGIHADSQMEKKSMNKTSFLCMKNASQQNDYFQGNFSIFYDLI